jgi:hypothetical protein
MVFCRPDDEFDIVEHIGESVEAQFQEVRKYNAYEMETYLREKLLRSLGGFFVSSEGTFASMSA